MKRLTLCVVCLVFGCGQNELERSDHGDLGLSSSADVGLEQPDFGGDVDSTAARIRALPNALEKPLLGLANEVFVLRTEGSIPHIYASNRKDLMYVYGYLIAADRFWMMDLARRIGVGNLSELFGTAALATDITVRAKGRHLVAQQIWQNLSLERKAEIQSFALGVNAYIDAVHAGELPPPSEYRLAYSLLGVPSAADLMKPFTGEDIAAYAAVVAEESACARNEVRRTRAVDDLLDRVDQPVDAASWQDVYADLFLRVSPIEFVSTSGPALRLNGLRSSQPLKLPNFSPSKISPSQLVSLARRLDQSHRFGGHIIGSNAWATLGAHTTTGGPIIAGDGHLELTAPAYFHQAGLDLSVFGEEDWHVRGNFMAGIPALGVGTNGHVAWSFTCFYSDTIDYFKETVILDEAGLPKATLFLGEEKALQSRMERYDVRDVPAFGGGGGFTEEPIYSVFDGRRILSIEGRPVQDNEVGQNLGDGEQIFEDIDGDGQITAISYDATYLDAKDLLGAYFDLSESQNLDRFKSAQRGLMLTGSHFIAADTGGDIVATGYHASPCRGHLARTESGKQFAPGANPQLVLDGTRYGGFQVLLDENGWPIEDGGGDENCVVPISAFPITQSPPEGFVVSANNDPVGLAFDGSIADDDIYIGGPWDIGFRALKIDERLGELVQNNTVSVDAMAHIQADIQSSGGLRWTRHILEAVEWTQNLRVINDTLSVEEARIYALYEDHQARIDDAVKRLSDWVNRGALAKSGVSTFYNSPTQRDRDDAVATTIFNFWLSSFKARLMNDLNLVPAHRLTDDNTIGRFIDALLNGRGPNNPNQLATYRESLGESSLFDDARTPEIETSRELILLGLIDALDRGMAPSEENGLGGFGTSEMSEWLWGLRHMVQIDSIVAPFVSDVPALSTFVNLFSIGPRKLPLVEGSLERTDPRRGLPGFPRPGDNYSVDSAEHGFSLSDFSYRAGPVMRMVIGFSADGRVTGKNIIPGGQSGLTDSPHFSDQLAAWLGNQAYPLRYHTEDVLDFATEKERYYPSPQTELAP